LLLFNSIAAEKFFALWVSSGWPFSPEFSLLRCMENFFKQNSKYKSMKNYFVTLIVASALTIPVVIIRQKAQAQNTSPQPRDKTATIC